MKIQKIRTLTSRCLACSENNPQIYLFKSTFTYCI
uniref:Uncharacterized protein n=1 Tax=Anguilla anguilla TaxID=7936 RepID=A0A0E9XCU1_ANGAN